MATRTDSALNLSEISLEEVVNLLRAEDWRLHSPAEQYIFGASPDLPGASSAAAREVKWWERGAGPTAKSRQSVLEKLKGIEWEAESLWLDEGDEGARFLAYDPKSKLVHLPEDPAKLKEVLGIVSHEYPNASRTAESMFEVLTSYEAKSLLGHLAEEGISAETLFALAKRPDAAVRWLRENYHNHRVAQDSAEIIERGVTQAVQQAEEAFVLESYRTAKQFGRPFLSDSIPEALAEAALMGDQKAFDLARKAHLAQTVVNVGETVAHEAGGELGEAAGQVAAQVDEAALRQGYIETINNKIHTAYGWGHSPHDNLVRERTIREFTGDALFRRMVDEGHIPQAVRRVGVVPGHGSVPGQVFAECFANASEEAGAPLMERLSTDTLRRLAEDEGGQIYQRVATELARLEEGAPVWRQTETILRQALTDPAAVLNPVERKAVNAQRLFYLTQGTEGYLGDAPNGYRATPKLAEELADALGIPMEQVHESLRQVAVNTNAATGALAEEAGQVDRVVTGAEDGLSHVGGEAGDTLNRVAANVGEGLEHAAGEVVAQTATHTSAGGGGLLGWLGSRLKKLVGLGGGAAATQTVVPAVTGGGTVEGASEVTGDLEGSIHLSNGAGDLDGHTTERLGDAETRRLGDAAGDLSGGAGDTLTGAGDEALRDAGGELGERTTETLGNGAGDLAGGAGDALQNAEDEALRGAGDVTGDAGRLAGAAGDVADETGAVLSEAERVAQRRQEVAELVGEHEDALLDYLKLSEEEFEAYALGRAELPPHAQGLIDGAEELAERRAAQNEAARLAREAEAERLASEAEAARLAHEAEVAQRRTTLAGQLGVEEDHVASALNMAEDDLARYCENRAEALPPEAQRIVDSVTQKRDELAKLFGITGDEVLGRLEMQPLDFINYAAHNAAPSDEALQLIRNWGTVRDVQNEYGRLFGKEGDEVLTHLKISLDELANNVILGESLPVEAARLIKDSEDILKHEKERLARILNVPEERLFTHLGISETQFMDHALRYEELPAAAQGMITAAEEAATRAAVAPLTHDQLRAELETLAGHDAGDVLNPLRHDALDRVDGLIESAGMDAERHGQVLRSYLDAGGTRGMTVDEVMLLVTDANHPAHALLADGTQFLDTATARLGAAEAGTAAYQFGQTMQGANFTDWAAGMAGYRQRYEQLAGEVHNTLNAYPGWNRLPPDVRTAVGGMVEEHLTGTLTERAVTAGALEQGTVQQVQHAMEYLMPQLDQRLNAVGRNWFRGNAIGQEKLETIVGANNGWDPLAAEVGNYLDYGAYWVGEGRVPEIPVRRSWLDAMAETFGTTTPVGLGGSDIGFNSAAAHAGVTPAGATSGSATASVSSGGYSGGGYYGSSYDWGSRIQSSAEKSAGRTESVTGEIASHAEEGFAAMIRRNPVMAAVGGLALLGGGLMFAGAGKSAGKAAKHAASPQAFSSVNEVDMGARGPAAQMGMTTAAGSPAMAPPAG